MRAVATATAPGLQQRAECGDHAYVRAAAASTTAGDSLPHTSCGGQRAAAGPAARPAARAPRFCAAAGKHLEQEVRTHAVDPEVKRA